MYLKSMSNRLCLNIESEAGIGWEMKIKQEVRIRSGKGLIQFGFYLLEIHQKASLSNCHHFLGASPNSTGPGLLTFSFYFFLFLTCFGSHQPDFRYTCSSQTNPEGTLKEHVTNIPLWFCKRISLETPLTLLLFPCSKVPLTVRNHFD